MIDPWVSYYKSSDRITVFVKVTDLGAHKYPDLGRRESLMAGGHVSEQILEEYCFNRLPDEENEVVVNHLADCPRCLNAMQQRSQFISDVKAAIALQHEQSTELDGLLGINCPDLDFAITGPLKF